MFMFYCVSVVACLCCDVFRYCYIHVCYVYVLICLCYVMFMYYYVYVLLCFCFIMLMFCYVYVCCVSVLLWFLLAKEKGIKYRLYVNILERVGIIITSKIESPP